MLAHASLLVNVRARATLLRCAILPNGCGNVRIVSCRLRSWLLRSPEVVSQGCDRSCHTFSSRLLITAVTLQAIAARLHLRTSKASRFFRRADVMFVCSACLLRADVSTLCGLRASISFRCAFIFPCQQPVHICPKALPSFETGCLCKQPVNSLSTPCPAVFVNSL